MADKLFPGLSSFEVQTSSEPQVITRGHRGGNGPPLILLHGFPQTHVIWHKIAPVLAKSYSLVIPDLRGYGASSKPSSPDPNDHTLYAKKAMAADMVELMASLGYDMYFIVAHDRGARLTHKLLLEYPQKVRKAILLDIAPTLAMLESTDSAIAAAYWHWNFLIQPAPFPEDVILANPEAFTRKCLRGLPTGSGGPGFFAEDAISEYAALFRDRATVHAMCEDYRAAATLDAEDQRETLRLGKKITVPLKLFWGKAGLVEKKFDNIKEWEKMCEVGVVDPKSRAMDCGHYIAEERPEELTEEILEFCT